MTHKTYESVVFKHPRMLFLWWMCAFIFSIGITSIGGNFRELLFLFLVPLFLRLFVRKWSIFFVIIWISGSILWWIIGKQSYDSHITDLRSMEYLTHSGEKKVAIRGTIDTLLYQWDYSRSYRLIIDNIDNSSPQYRQKNTLGILVEIPSNLPVQIGDTISFTGKVMPTIQSLKIDGFSRYSFHKQLYGKTSLLTFEKITNKQVSILERIWASVVTIFFQGFPRETSAIISWMVFGNTDLLEKKTKDAFILSGIMHILVVSGSNIALVIILSLTILRYIPWLPSWGKIISVILFVLIYATIVGWWVSVIRAVTMGLIAFLAVIGNKKTASISILALVAFLFIIHDPLVLMYDAGFGLSFGATLGILLFHKKISEFLKNFVIPLWTKDTLAVTFSATLGSTPVLIYHFGEISSGIILTNILISFVIGWITLLSVFYIPLSFIGGYFLYMYWFLLYIPVKYILLIAGFFSLSETIKVSGIYQYLIPIILLGYIIVEVFFQENTNLILNQKGGSDSSREIQ